MREAKLEPTAISYNAGISACEKSEQWQRALALLSEMRETAQAKLEPTAIFSYNAGISACEKGDQWQRALALVSEMREAKLEPDVTSYSAGISACEKGEQWRRALALVSEMREAKLEPDVISYNAGVSASKKGEQWQRSLAQLSEMREAKLEPDVISYSAWISACAKGKRWQWALALLSEMQEVPAVDQALNGHCLMRAAGGLLAALSSRCGEQAHDLTLNQSHVWRMLHFNPLAATAGDRLEEIELACSNFDAITLVGTQRRTKERMEQSRSGSRWRIDAGWSAGSMTNKSTGVLISFGAKIRQKHLRKVQVPPAHLAGRGLAVRVSSSSWDLTVIGAYYPPRPTTVKALQVYDKTVTALTDWLDLIISSTPTRSVPILGVDLNDGLGKDYDTARGGEYLVETSAVLPAGVRWDRDKLMQAYSLAGSEEGEQFITQIEQHLEQNAEEVIALINHASPDPLFEYLESLMIAVGRCKENAIITVNTTLYRIKQAGRSCLQHFHDLSNAFGSTEWTELDNASMEFMREDLGGEFGQQRYHDAVISLPSMNGTSTLLKPTCGALMGDPYVVRLFVLGFQTGVNQWTRALTEKGIENEELRIESPFTKRTVDLSLCQYADDLSKTILGKEGEGLEELTSRSIETNEELDISLETIGCRQNRSKQEIIPVLAGPGSYRDALNLRLTPFRDCKSTFSHTLHLSTLYAVLKTMPFELKVTRLQGKTQELEVLGVPYVHVFTAMLQGMAKGDLGEGIQHEMEKFWSQSVEGKTAQQLQEVVLHCRAKPAKKKDGQPEMTKIVFALSRDHDGMEKLLVNVFKGYQGIVKMGPAPRGPLERAAQKLLDEYEKKTAEWPSGPERVLPEMAFGLYYIAGPSACQKGAVSYNAAVSACEKGEQWQRALVLLSEMRGANLQPDVTHLQRRGQRVREGRAVAAGCGASQRDAGGAAGARRDQLLRWDQRVREGRAVAAGSGAAKRDVGGEAETEREQLQRWDQRVREGEQWQRALALLSEMQEAKLKPNVISYNAGISACEKGKQWQRTLALLSEIISLSSEMILLSRSRITGEAKLEPNPVSYNAGINACETGGEQW
ncbi:unnamed protein product [Prorocentrum cordatum]|uniref:PROP1-like PPR domain-containing protein n=1 Tax=Prorocentrum cordatum TaxID=2364126 RepID=A0ABN9PAB8_9DINO|nr:unnamed protein product [Polarella glacialis]